MRTEQALASFLAAALAACHGSRTFTSEEGRFSVAMPHEPEHEERTIDPEDPTTVHFFTANDGVLVFSVAYHDGLAAGRTPEEAFEGARLNALSKPGRKVLSEAEISLGSHPGRELMISETRGLMRLRMFVVGSRFYLVMVVGKDDALLKRRSARFYESFRVF